jgi:hypothetical protein
MTKAHNQVNKTGINSIYNAHILTYLCLCMCIGSVYVYASAGNIWSRQSKILAKDGATGDQFGVSVGVYGTVAMII